MNKNIQGIIAIAVVGIIGYLAYKKLGNPNPIEVVTNYLNATFGFIEGRSDVLKKMDKGYVDNWSEAIMNGKDSFQFNGVIYNTKGGATKK